MKQIIERCPHCNSKISKHKETLCKVHISGLWKAYKYMLERNSISNILSHEFTIKELQESDFKLTTGEYARFNDLPRFGLLFKTTTRNGKYHLSLERVESVLRGEGGIAPYFLRNKLTRAIELPSERILIGEVRGVYDIQREFGEKMSEYLPSGQTKLL